MIFGPAPIADCSKNKNVGWGLLVLSKVEGPHQILSSNQREIRIGRGSKGRFQKTGGRPFVSVVIKPLRTKCQKVFKVNHSVLVEICSSAPFWVSTVFHFPP